MTETIGYIVIEAGSANVGEFHLVADTGADVVEGIGNAPSYVYSLAGLTDPISAVVSAAGMDGNDGGWPILYGNQPVTAGTLHLAIDEDQIANSERRHTSEQVAYLVVEQTAQAAAQGVAGNTLPPTDSNFVHGFGSNRPLSTLYAGSFGTSLNLGTDVRLTTSTIDSDDDNKDNRQRTFDVVPIDMATNKVRLRPSPVAASALVDNALVRDTTSDIEEQLIDHVFAEWRMAEVSLTRSTAR